MNAAQARARGRMLGQIAGDSLGSLVEFLSAPEIAAAYPDGGPRDLATGGVWGTLPGQPTDDSEMALALARTLLERQGWDAAAVRAAYVAWRDSGPFDIGDTIEEALHHAVPNRTTPSNGSLMRASPLGILAAGDPATAATLGEADSIITHAHPVCVAAVRAFCAAIAAGIGGADATAMAAAAAAEAGDGEGATIVRATLQVARDGPPDEFVTRQGWVLIALRNAFFRLGLSEPLADALTATVRCGGDTDTNAAIAGALLGAALGIEAVPERWRSAKLGCRASVEARAMNPRPEACWPVDVLDIADRLLALSPLCRNVAA